jgi:hypothetical protein
MILIIHEKLAEEFPITIKQLRFSTLIAIRHDDDMHTIVKNRLGNHGKKIDKAEMSKLVALHLL